MTEESKWFHVIDQDGDKHSLECASYGCNAFGLGGMYVVHVEDDKWAKFTVAIVDSEDLAHEIRDNIIAAEAGETVFVNELVNEVDAARKAKGDGFEMRALAAEGKLREIERNFDRVIGSLGWDAIGGEGCDLKADVYDLLKSGGVR